MFGLQNIGMPEVIIAAVVLLIIFGPKKLPEFAKGISQAIKESTSGLKTEKKTDKKK